MITSQVFSLDDAVIQCLIYGEHNVTTSVLHYDFQINCLYRLLSGIAMIKQLNFYTQSVCICICNFVVAVVVVVLQNLFVYALQKL